MVLRQLAQGRVGGGDDLDHLHQGHIGHSGTAVFAGNGDAPQATGGELLQFGDRQAPLAIPYRGIHGKAPGQGSGDTDGFGIALDDMGIAGGWAGAVMGRLRFLMIEIDTRR